MIDYSNKNWIFGRFGFKLSLDVGDKSVIAVDRISELDVNDTPKLE